MTDTHPTPQETMEKVKKLKSLTEPPTPPVENSEWHDLRHTMWNLADDVEQMHKDLLMAKSVIETISQLDTPEEIKNDAESDDGYMGLDDAEEGIEMAYENAIWHAKQALSQLTSYQQAE